MKDSRKSPLFDVADEEFDVTDLGLAQKDVARYAVYADLCEGLRGVDHHTNPRYMQNVLVFSSSNPKRALQFAETILLDGSILYQGGATTVRPTIIFARVVAVEVRDEGE